MTGRKKTGKLAARTLARLLDRYTNDQDPAVLVGPGVGVDAAAVTVPAGALVLASDPVTYATERLGHYAVHVNANDVFASGAEPRWFLADILLPPGRGRLAERIFAQIHRSCSELGVSLIGGHTEITPDLPRPIVAGFMVGQALGDRVLTARDVRPGDAIILTKGVAIEGTAIIAGEREAELLKGVPARTVRRAKRMLDKPGLSVGPEARIVVDRGVHAMHDPTEGGLLNGLWEMSEASQLAFHVDQERVAVYSETRAVCTHFRLDPMKLLASGALLLACPAEAAGGVLDALASRDIPATEIGRARKGTPGVHLTGGKIIRKAVTDEILKIFGPAGPG